MLDQTTVARRESIAQMLGHFGRDEVESAVDILLTLLDVADGDPDLEDSEAGNTNVDARGRYLHDDAPTTQDEDREPDDDAKGDISWTEWHTRGRHKLRADGREAPSHSLVGWELGEDDEDDDADTGIEDDPLGCDAETDFGLEEGGELTSAETDGGGQGMGVPSFGDDHSEPDQHPGRQAQCHRIRMERCAPRVESYRHWNSGQRVSELRGYDLIHDPRMPSSGDLLRRKRGLPAEPRP